VDQALILISTILKFSALGNYEITNLVKVALDNAVSHAPAHYSSNCKLAVQFKVGLQSLTQLGYSTAVHRWGVPGGF